MITVHVKLFATLRRQFPDLGLGERLPVELPPGTTVGGLVEHMRLPADQVKMIFVNNVIQEAEHKLADGDEVGVFPPVGGG